MDLDKTRVANGRLAIEKVGGVSKAAKLLGLQNPSYLSQMFGPNPTRTPGEKFVRRLEKALDLASGTLDGRPADTLPPKAQTAIDPQMLAQVIQTVNRVIEDENVRLSVDRFATLVVMTYEAPQAEGRLRQVVQLLK